MSDNHHLALTPTLVSEVDHTHLLSENIGQLYQNKEYSDVTFMVESEEFHAHKVILAARSDYFRALLFGGMRESQQSTIELKETNVVAFRSLLKYIYTGYVTFAGLKEDTILDILSLSHHYNIVELETAISNYLKAILNIKNVCIIYDTAYLYQLNSLVDICLVFMDRHALEIIQHESFLLLSAPAVKFAISKDSFCAPEIDIFRAISEWKKQNVSEHCDNNDVMDTILEAIRFPLISLPDLLNVVRPSKLLSPDAILDAIKSRTECRDVELKYRGYLMPEENIASRKHNSHVLHGEMRTALLDGDNQNYDMDKGFTRHSIDDHNGQGILIKLGMQCIINHVKMLLWDRDARSYSYYIEVSMDMKDWIRVVDHTQYLCRSWQHLYFPIRVARYIRVIGTHNTVNRVFHVVSFSCMYTMDHFDVDNGIVVPRVNVADQTRSAVVIEGVSRSRNALLNGDIERYDWDSGYTCHQLGSGAVVIQLAQPYAIDSMRLLLWDIDDRTYSYYIEVSIDQHNWEMVVDRSKELCRSWQVVRFRRRPVTFIRIVGTRNSANEVFHCVHFECPSQEDKEQKCRQDTQHHMEDCESIHSGSNDIHRILSHSSVSTATNDDDVR